MDLRVKTLQDLKDGTPGKAFAEVSDSRVPHKVLTPEEYNNMALKGWHEVCKNVDGFGAVGIRFLSETHEIP